MDLHNFLRETRANHPHLSHSIEISNSAWKKCLALKQIQVLACFNSLPVHQSRSRQRFTPERGHRNLPGQKQIEILFAFLNALIAYCISKHIRFITLQRYLRHIVNVGSHSGKVWAGPEDCASARIDLHAEMSLLAFLGFWYISLSRFPCLFLI